MELMPALMVTDRTAGNLTVAWDDFKPAQFTRGYIVQYRERTVDGSAKWIPLQSDSTPVATLTGLTPGTTYEVRVKATRTDGAEKKDILTEIISVNTEDGCVFNETAYGLKEQFEKGCDSRCICAANDTVECSERCSIPFFKIGTFANDSMCFERPEEGQDQCCVLVTCAGDKPRARDDSILLIHDDSCPLPTGPCMKDEGENEMETENCSDDGSCHSGHKCCLNACKERRCVLLQRQSLRAGSNACDNILCGPGAICANELTGPPKCKCLPHNEGNPNDLIFGCSPFHPNATPATGTNETHCIYGNTTFNIGDEFKDGCVHNCKCNLAAEIECVARCPPEPEVKDNCVLVTDPTDECCKVLYCDDSDIKRNGTKLQGKNKHKKDGFVPTPGDVDSHHILCVFKGVKYELGERFFDGCELSCECLGPNDIGCKPRCPLHAPTNGSCSLVADPSDNCCQISVCRENGTLHITDSAVQPTTPTLSKKTKHGADFHLKHKQFQKGPKSLSEGKGNLTDPMMISATSISETTVSVVEHSGFDHEVSSTEGQPIKLNDREVPSDVFPTGSSFDIITKEDLLKEEATGSSVRGSESKFSDVETHLGFQTHPFHEFTTSTSTSTPSATQSNDINTTPDILHSFTNVFEEQEHNSSPTDSPAEPQPTTTRAVVNGTVIPPFDPPTKKPISSIAESANEKSPKKLSHFEKDSSNDTFGFIEGSQVVITSIHSLNATAITVTLNFSREIFDRLLLLDGTISLWYTDENPVVENIEIWKKTQINLHNIRITSDGLLEMDVGSLKADNDYFFQVVIDEVSSSVSEEDAKIPSSNKHKDISNEMRKKLPFRLSNILSATTSRTSTADTPSEGVEGKQGCKYSNQRFTVGEEFYDGCQFKCKCLHSGEVRCLERCPPITPEIMEKCTEFIKDPLDECCSICKGMSIETSTHDIFDTNNFTRHTCEFKGRLYQHGDEIIDGCDAICQCGLDGNVHCANVECPHLFGSTITGCMEWEIDANFKPTPGNCCAEVRCKHDNFCAYKGHTFRHQERIPEKFLEGEGGCGMECTCMGGNVTCLNRCNPVSDTPPDFDGCSPDDVVLAAVSVSDCCLVWQCRSLTTSVVTSMNTETFSTENTLFCEDNGDRYQPDQQWEVGNGCSRKHCVCEHQLDGTVAAKCQGHCPSTLDKFTMPTPECPSPRIITPDDPCLCPYVVCDKPEHKITNFTLVALSPSVIRVYFVLPQALVGLFGIADVYYTDEFPQTEFTAWSRETYSTPGGLFSSNKVEHDITGLKPDVVYFVKVTVSMRDSNEKLSTEEVEKTRTLSDVTTTTFMGVLDLNVHPRVIEVQSNLATVQWEPIDSQKKKFVDGIYLKFRTGEGEWSESEPIHRDVTVFTIHGLIPSSEYELMVVFMKPSSIEAVEIYSGQAIHFNTLNVPVEDVDDSANVTLILKKVTTNSIDIFWSTMVHPESKGVTVYRILYKNDKDTEPQTAFKVPKRSQTQMDFTIESLRPGNRYQVWVEAYMHRGEIKLSNTIDAVTKAGLPIALDSERGKDKAEASHLGISAHSLESPSGRASNNDAEMANAYLAGLIVVAVIGGVCALGFFVLLVMLLRKQSSAKAPITSSNNLHHHNHKTQAAYDNPTYKPTYDGEVENGKL